MSHQQIAALHGRRTVTMAGMQVVPPRRPTTKVLEGPLPGLVTNTFFPALVPRMASRRRKVLGALAVGQRRPGEAWLLLDEGLDLSLAANSTQNVTLCLAAFA